MPSVARDEQRAHGVRENRAREDAPPARVPETRTRPLTYGACFTAITWPRTILQAYPGAEPRPTEMIREVTLAPKMVTNSSASRRAGAHEEDLEEPPDDGIHHLAAESGECTQHDRDEDAERSCGDADRQRRRHTVDDA